MDWISLKRTFHEILLMKFIRQKSVSKSFGMNRDNSDPNF